MSHRHFPLFFDLTGKAILFVGGGSIALRRLKTLLPFLEPSADLDEDPEDPSVYGKGAGAPKQVGYEKQGVTVVAQRVSLELESLAKEHPMLQLYERAFAFSDLEGHDLVFACTDDEGLNGRIAAECKARGILVNNCSKKEDCDFHFPGIGEKGNVVIGITASGEDHKKAKRIRERIGEVLDQLDGPESST